LIGIDMRRSVYVLVVLCACGIVAPRASQGPPPPQTFRANVDLVELDVTVLDKQRRAVGGLTASDFTILEDGLVRPIAAFTAVSLPARAPTPAPWMRDSSPDVTSNTLPEEGRLVLIVMDRSISVGEPMMTAQRIALAAIDALGPGDEAAVVHTGPGPAQNFTTDRARLRRAVGMPNAGDVVSGESAAIEQNQIAALAEDTGIELAAITNTGSCYCGLCVLDTIARGADALRGVVARKKTMLFIGTQVVLQGRVVANERLSAGPEAIDSNTECGARLDESRTRMLRALDLANVTIYSIDPSGLSTVVPTARASLPSVRGGPGAQSRATVDALAENNSSQNSLHVLPDYTGGRVILNTNAAADDVRDIFAESGTYYLLGFRPGSTSADGKYHRIDVKVNRRDVRVTARRGYLAPRAAPAVAQASASDAVPASLRAAIAPLIPKRELPVSVAAVPVSSNASTGAEVVVTLGLTPSANAPAPATLDVVVEAFNANGRPVVTFHESVAVTQPAGPAVPVETVARLPLKPGQYELRAAVEESGTGKVGAVYGYVDVPRFGQAPLSLSGAALTSTRSPATSGPNLADVLPFVPTTNREFRRDERATLFVRVHQSSPIKPVVMSLRIRGATNRVVFDQPTSLAEASFGTSRAAIYQIDLPLSSLAPGAYLATLEASRGKDKARRDVQFTVR